LLKFAQQKPVNRSNRQQDAKAAGVYFLTIMKAIRIIKREQVRIAAEAAADESKKAVEPITRSVADTVKSWILEAEQRKRSQRHSLAALGFLVLIAFTVGMAQSSQQPSDRALAPPVKVTITTTAGFLGQPVNRYKVGEQIPVSITMTNTSMQPLNTCISSDIYQDLPKLTRDGKVVPYANAQSFEARYSKHNEVCKEENLPEPVRLEPNKPIVADWFVLVGDGVSTQADAWYDPLSVGRYELSLQRRLSCCDGPTVESNTINFEVVP